MIYQTKHITLRDGTAAILRAPVPHDAEALIDLLRTTTAETPYLASYPEEITLSAEDEERWIVGHRESPLVLNILCEIDGEIVGSCELLRKKPEKMRHRATVGISIRRAFWGRGIGTRLFEEMIAAARAWGIGQMELEYMEGNLRGEALYRKMGFHTVAERPQAIRLRDGRLLSEYIMIKEL